MGHLMCAGCFTHLLADGRLRDTVATCPNCRVEISKNNASRNLAVEKAVSELPSECQVNNYSINAFSVITAQLTFFYFKFYPHLTVLQSGISTFFFGSS